MVAVSVIAAVTFTWPRGRRSPSGCGCDGLDPVQGYLPAAACFGSVEGAGDALDHDRRDAVAGAVCGEGQVGVLVVGLVVDLEGERRGGIEPVLGEPGVRLAVVPSSGCALTGPWPSTTIRSPSPTSPSPTRGCGRRIPRRGTRPQVDSDGVLASFGGPCAQVSVEQLELGDPPRTRRLRPRVRTLGPAQTVVAADRDREWYATPSGEL